jgi:hypothetical protein
MNEKKHTNRLINETSPYLREHAHNPVDWYAWCDEAFEEARQQDKPILLSIGYAACHWCHVMAGESFENEEIARLMNENFVCIKVDREERPDLDAIYMSAVQAMTGHGGWPMTVFLTPDRIPFYGGTYFPPEDRRGMPGFPRILNAVADAYRTRRSDITSAGRDLMAHIQQLSELRPSDQKPASDLLDLSYESLARNFDSTYGGFGGAPKFPASMNLQFLLQTFQRTGDQQALEMVELTLQQMACGGIYDHLGGGFHRYSVDAKWLVPHFEKMLYDNALLARTYLYAYQATDNPFYRRIVEETLDYVIREMTDPLGGFYSTQDADSDGEEGKFFVWTPQEIKGVLGEKEGELFCRYYGVTEWGNFEDKNILSIPRDTEVVAKLEGIEVESLLDVIDRGGKKLFLEREKRVKPRRDEKILADWNGLMLTSFAEAAAVLEREDYYQVAVNNVEFLLTHLRRDGRLLHTYKDSVAKLDAYLDDYANLIAGLLSLYECDFDLRWLSEAVRLTDAMIETFWDTERGGFYFTSEENTDVVARMKDFFDNATPSGNSVAADVLLRLSVLTGREDYRERASVIFRLVMVPVARYPSGFGRLLCALDFLLSTPKEIALVGEPDSPDTKAMLAAIRRHYLPNKVIALLRPGDERAPQLIPLLQSREPRGDAASFCTVYVCENYVCRAPVTDVADLEIELSDARTP